jgi:hypothetical protein
VYVAEEKITQAGFLYGQAASPGRLWAWPKGNKASASGAPQRMAVTVAAISIIVRVDACWKLSKRTVADTWRYNLWCREAIMGIPRYQKV